jgi:hypothetical protein
MPRERFETPHPHGHGVEGVSYVVSSWVWLWVCLSPLLSNATTIISHHLTRSQHGTWLVRWHSATEVTKCLF